MRLSRKTIGALLPTSINSDSLYRNGKFSKRSALKRRIVGNTLIAVIIAGMTLLLAGQLFAGGPEKTIAPPEQFSTIDRAGHARRMLLASLSNNGSNSSFPERCGGKDCKMLSPKEQQAFCKSDPYPTDDELENFHGTISVGTLYEFYCDTYNHPPSYDVFVGCGLLSCDTPALLAILPLIGMLYMFLGLAIICDEFFVPALEIMVEKYEVDDDVAGATFMAAGGSAPELFTAMVSTFVAPPSASDTGFGTIVGSAVFNVLFVIGACAIFSKGVLELSWWPLARDSTYYTISLIILAVFFGTGSSNPSVPASMEWWECLILLVLYVGYVIMMKYNRWIHYHIMKCHLDKKKKRKMKQKEKEAASSRNSGDKSSTPTKVSPKRPSSMVRRDSSRSVLLEQLARRAEAGGEPRKSQLHFRAGVLHLMVSEKSLLETAGIHLVTKVAGDVKETFHSIAGETKKMSRQQLSRLLKCMGVVDTITEDQVNQAFEKLDKDNDGSIDWIEFKDWYASSEAKIWADCDTVFKEIDQNGDGTISRDELVYLLNSILEREPSPNEIEDAWLELLSKMSEEEIRKQEDGDDEMYIPQDLFNEWFAKSVFFEDRQKAGVLVDEDNHSCFPPWPSESLQAKLLYIVSLPLVIPIYCTTPDVNQPRFEKLFLFTFFMSILWIAVFACKFTKAIISMPLFFPYF